MSTRSESIQNDGVTVAESHPALITKTMTVEALLSLGRSLFSEFPYDEENFESRRGHVAFGTGRGGCIMTVRALHGVQYGDSAAVIRESFSTSLPVKTGPLMRTREAAGFTYAFTLEAFS